MAIEWITAATALRYLSDKPYTFSEQLSICERAHHGLIEARAEKLIWGDEAVSRRTIPKEFWWAEGQEALSQNWDTGDFSTWIDQRFEVKAFGVSFDFLAIADLLPAEKRAEGMKRISVAANPDWLHAREVNRRIYEGKIAFRGGPVILEACKLGQLTARAARATGFRESPLAGHRSREEWAAIEWDVPLWFWRDFTKAEQSRQDWSLGTARGKAFRGGAADSIELQGLHFHRSGLSFLGLAEEEIEAPEPTHSNRGRRPKYDWSAASIAVYGRLSVAI